MTPIQAKLIIEAIECLCEQEETLNTEADRLSNINHHKEAESLFKVAEYIHNAIYKIEALF